MEPELNIHPVGLTTYVQCYGDRHWGNLTNYGLNMVVRPITTSSLFRRVYSTISSRSMRFPGKSAQWGAQCVNIEAFPSGFFSKVDGNQQLPAALPSIRRLKENGNGESQWNYPPCRDQCMGQAILPTRLGFWTEDLQVNLCNIQAHGSRWIGLWRRNTF